MSAGHAIAAAKQRRQVIRNKQLSALSAAARVSRFHFLKGHRLLEFYRLSAEIAAVDTEIERLEAWERYEREQTWPFCLDGGP